MLTKSGNKPKSLVLAYVSIFAALNALADFVPFTPILGIAEASFRLGWIMSTLTGILLGAKAGGISCLIGGLIGISLGQPPIFGFYTPLRPAISAFIAGMLVSRSWHIPALSLSALISVWLLLPTGRDASMVLIFHVVGLAVVILLRGKIGALVESKDSYKVSWGFFFVAYCGNISRHLLGSVFSATFLNVPSIVFITAMPYTLVEQLTFAVATMIMGMSLNHLGLRYLLQQS